VVSSPDTLVLVLADGRTVTASGQGLAGDLAQVVRSGLSRARADGRAASEALTKFAFLLSAEVAAEVDTRSATSATGSGSDSDGEPHALCVRDVVELVAELGERITDRAVRLAADRQPLDGVRVGDRWFFRESSAREFARQVVDRKRERSA
jgi:hypothetical protein